MSKTAQKHPRKIPTSKRVSLVPPFQPPLPFWSRFNKSQCKGKYDLRALLALNAVNLAVPAPATKAEQIRAIAAGAASPLPIDYLDPVLGQDPSIRGAVFSDDLGKILNRFAVFYRDMTWWLSDDGLVMKIVEPPPNTGDLSAFNRIVGERMTARASGERLSASELRSIVTEIDETGEKLKENLQPAQWEKIASYNQKNSRAPIRTFSDALKVPAFSTFVRRRLYVARDAYASAVLQRRSHLEKYDAHFSRNTSILL